MVIRERTEGSILVRKYSAAKSADPKYRIPVDEQCRDDIDFELRCVFPVEDSELNTVKPGEPLLRSDPQITIGSLCEGVGKVLRKTILLLPILLGEKVERSLHAGRVVRPGVWPESKGRDGGGKEEND